MLKKLVNDGYVEHEVRGDIKLTRKGLEVAVGVVRRNRLAERLLTDVLGMPWDEVYAEACILEHAITDKRRGASRRRRSANPQTCPHGHPIPPKDLTEPVRTETPLAQVEPGSSVTVSGVTEQMPEILRYLAQVGLRPGVKLARHRKGAARRPDNDRDSRRTSRDLARARAHGHDRVITRFLIVVNFIAFLWEFSVGGPGMLRRFGSNGSGFEHVLDDGALGSGRRAAVWAVVAHRHRRLSARRLDSHRRQHDVALVSRPLHRVVLGSWRMLLVYMVSLVVSGLGVVYFSNPMMPTLGASGAIFGLFGALFAIGFKLGKPGMDLVRSNIGILVLNLIITFTVPAISWQAHVAGLAGRLRADLRDLFSAAARRAGRRRTCDRPRTGNGVPIAARTPDAVSDLDELFFGRRCPLANATGGSKPRAGQLADGAARRARHPEGVHTIVEAGTGVGKSLAYLVPAVRSGKKVVLSTGTIALQEQLVRKDIPMVAAGTRRTRCASRSSRGAATISAGRSSSECAPTGSSPPSRPRCSSFGAWGERTQTGDRAELSVRAARSKSGSSSMPTPTTASASSASTFRIVSSSAGATRRGTPTSSSSITRSSFSTSRWEAASLPPYDAVVLDEAHQCERWCTDALTATLSRATVGRLLRKLHRSYELPLCVRRRVRRRHARARSVARRACRGDRYPLAARRGRLARARCGARQRATGSRTGSSRTGWALESARWRAMPKPSVDAISPCARSSRTRR